MGSVPNSGSLLGSSGFFVRSASSFVLSAYSLEVHEGVAKDSRVRVVSEVRERDIAPALDVSSLCVRNQACVKLPELCIDFLKHLLNLLIICETIAIQFRKIRQG